MPASMANHPFQQMAIGYLFYVFLDWVIFSISDVSWPFFQLHSTDQNLDREAKQAKWGYTVCPQRARK